MVGKWATAENEQFVFFGAFLGDIINWTQSSITAQKVCFSVLLMVEGEEVKVRTHGTFLLVV